MTDFLLKLMPYISLATWAAGCFAACCLITVAPIWIAVLAYERRVDRQRARAEAVTADETAAEIRYLHDLYDLPAKEAS